MRFIRTDFTHFMAAPLRSLVVPKSDREIHARLLSIDELLELQKDPKYDLSLAAINDLKESGKYCFGTFNERVVSAYTFFATKSVAPENNRGSYYFGGIGMRLPEDVIYTYKCFTLPAYRGQRQVQIAIIEGVKKLVSTNGWLVTTVDVNNKSSINMMKNIGLNQIQILREFRIFGKRAYRIPKSILLSEEIERVELITPG